MNNSGALNFETDVELIGGIEAAPTILQVVCQTTGMGFAAIARVTEARWVACAVLDRIGFGLRPGGALKIDTTICNEVRQAREAIVIDDVAADDCYRDHPTPAMYGFKSYISMPIILRDGSFFGTLCAIDPRPNRLKKPDVVGMFKLFAELIAFQIDASERVASSEASLLDAQKTAELREQFIAVLGHDLRNPLASIDAGARQLLRTPLDERARMIVGMMQGSVLRMSHLIANLLDFARGRLGGGFALNRTRDKPLKPHLTQVAGELLANNPGRAIDMRLDFDDPVDCDIDRIAQLFSNLLGNALAHGSPSGPIGVEAAKEDNLFRLSVTNIGEPIRTDELAHLFSPFSRGAPDSGKQGLGLGLYIASEIARAHDGKMTVASSSRETRFTFEMPSR